MTDLFIEILEKTMGLLNCTLEKLLSVKDAL